MMRCEAHEPFIQHDEKRGGGMLTCMWMAAFPICLFHMVDCFLYLPCLFCTDQEDVDEVDVSSVPAEVLRNIEADTYWCMSKLLDGIQVSLKLQRLQRLSTTSCS